MKNTINLTGHFDYIFTKMYKYLHKIDYDYAKCAVH